MMSNSKISKWIVGIGAIFPVIGNAAEFQPLGKAIASVLGTAQAFKKQVGANPVFYSKDAAGKPKTLAFVQKNVYEPSCTHTWVVGVDAQTSKVTGVQVVEMSCPHAFPTREASFLQQYVGKGPAEVKELDKKIDTVAKATGSSNLATDAVRKSITEAVKIKGSL